MLGVCWADVVDGGPAWAQHCLNVLCFLGYIHLPLLTAAHCSCIHRHLFIHLHCIILYRWYIWWYKIYNKITVRYTNWHIEIGHFEHLIFLDAPPPLLLNSPTTWKGFPDIGNNQVNNPTPPPPGGTFEVLILSHSNHLAQFGNTNRYWT